MRLRLWSFIYNMKGTKVADLHFEILIKPHQIQSFSPTFRCSEFTITICPGHLVHRMGKLSWRNDNGEEFLILASLSSPAASTMRLLPCSQFNSLR